MNLIGKTPKEKLTEYNTWNSGEKKFSSGVETLQPPRYVAEFIDFMLNLPKLSKRDEPISPELPERKVGSEIRNSIDNLDVSDDEKQYLSIFGMRESGLNSQATSRTGTYKGLYQFGPPALADVGISEDDYLGNINIQHEAALKLKEKNLKRLTPYKQYIGEYYMGIPITENGMAAAAHLLGVGGVKAFFDQGEIRRDGLGTPITEYFKLFV